jgi:hypothetical protein
LVSFRFVPSGTCLMLPAGALLFCFDRDRPAQFVRVVGVRCHGPENHRSPGGRYWLGKRLCGESYWRWMNAAIPGTVNRAPRRTHPSPAACTSCFPAICLFTRHGRCNSQNLWVLQRPLEPKQEFCSLVKAWRSRRVVPRLGACTCRSGTVRGRGFPQPPATERRREQRVWRGKQTWQQEQ